jgi:serine/threonine protein kinase
VEEAQQLGQYSLEERVGEGGMGEVYRASHLLLRRPTAVKLLRSDHVDGPSIVRFEREVQLTSRLTHPNTSAIYDYGRTPEGRFYYAMEYLDGVNLEQLIHVTGALPPARVIHILRQVCASLAEAHRSGLIHRDIKPANVVLCERGGIQDFVKVVDFGLVKDIVAETDPNVSSANTITGTPLYLSPEAIRAPETVDGRSDLYAVGALGYYLLTGTPLFQSANVMEICNHQMNTAPQSPSERIGKAQPHDLEAVILQCLEKNPATRPQDAEAVCEALAACEDAKHWSTAEAAKWWSANKANATLARTQDVGSSSAAATATASLAVNRSPARAPGP